MNTPCSPCSCTVLALSTKRLRMAQVFACDVCGYRPRVDDCHEVMMHEGDPNEFMILHVICYGCGKEWVE
ncbi:MAG: hypothetical protein ACO22U_16885 [bacterium]